MRYLLALVIAAMLPSCRSAEQKPEPQYFVPCFYFRDEAGDLWHFCREDDWQHHTDTATYSNCFFLKLQRDGLAVWKPVQ